MDHLNHFRRLKYLPAILVGKLLFINTLYAGVIQFFDPTQTPKNRTIKTEFKTFIANDPMPIKEFLDDWHGEYTPKDKENIALLNSRFDLGIYLNNLYFGYFYQYDVFIDTNKDFTDLFYAVKNKNDLEIGRHYSLDLDIQGIKQHGVMLSKNSKLVENDSYSLSFGGAVYLSYALDMQDGFTKGDAQASGSKDYIVEGSSSYYYTHNYLYHLDISNSSGYGFGSHIGLFFKDKKNNFQIKFLINDALSKIYWKDLPYSKILLKTQNKSYDKNGYLKYTPTISGLEQYRDYTQTLSPKYKLESSFILEDGAIFGGVDFAYSELFPFIKVLYKFDDLQKFELSYESRFESFGVGYSYKNFNISIMADDISNISSLGLNSNFIFRF